MKEDYLQDSGACISAKHEVEKREEENFTLTSPPPKIDKAKEEINSLIQTDIHRARLNIRKLPESQRRGLTLETMRHFGFGYLEDWVHPKFCTRKQILKDKADGKKRYPSRRIIITTPNFHYLALMLDADRAKCKKDDSFVKPHAGTKELFNPIALESDAEVIVVVEGEIDCASIWQATQGRVAVVGCSGGNKNLLLDALDRTPTPVKKFLVVFDNDVKDNGENPGQRNAAALVNALIRKGYPAVNRIFEDVMAKSEIDACADSSRKIDANQILRRKGNEFLGELMTALINDARADFEDAAKKVVEVKAKLEAEGKAQLEAAKIAKAKAEARRAQSAAYHSGSDFDDADKKAEFERLIAEINSITADELKSRGYLNHSECGGAEPDGYVCPFCNSGTGSHKSGAMTFYESQGNNHFHCHACEKHGSVLKLLAFQYNLNTRGKDFIELVKRAANEFSISYDERLFMQNNRAKKTKAQKRQEAIDKANATRAEAKTKLDELRDLPDTPANREAIRQELWRLCEWNRDKYNRPTSIKATVCNLDLVFGNDKALKNFVGYNEFFSEMVALKDLYWRKDSAGTEWTDRDESQLRNYLRRNYAELKSSETIHDCLVEISQRNAFHPVKDFFKSLPDWDGKPRAETLFIDFLRADDTPFVREVTLNWLTAAIARIFYPGVDYQIAPILLGQQGIGKSYLLNKLGGKWYGALSDDVDDPHAIDAIQRMWLCEIKEMASMKKDVDSNKRFIDTAVDTRRKPYDRYPTASPRHCVFAITTNNRQCLTDMTGNRRYPVIDCKAKPGEYADGLNDEFILQLWAEVYRLFKEKFGDTRDIDFVGRGLELSREVKKQVLATAETYTRDDGLGSVIKGFLDTPILPQVFWRLLTREDRRKFFVDGQITFDEATLNFRRRAQGGNQKDIERDIAAMDKIYRSQCIGIREIKNFDKTQKVFYGSELREHITAAEIYEECFGNDRRKTPNRIYEILSQIDGWALGERLRGEDPYYRDQKKVYYRQSTEGEV